MDILNCGFLISGNNESEEVKIEVISNEQSEAILLSDFIRKYLAEKLPEALPYAKAIESDVVKMLKTVDLSEKMEYPPTANQNSAKKLQKRDLRSQFPQPAVKELEDYVRTYLAFRGWYLGRNEGIENVINEIRCIRYIWKMAKWNRKTKWDSTTGTKTHKP